MIKLIIFDVGGVLVDFSEQEYAAYISPKLGIKRSEFIKVLKPMIAKMEVGEMRLSEMSKELASCFGIAESKFEFTDAFEKIAKPNQNVINVAKKLSKRYKVVLLTNVSFPRYLPMKHMFLDRLGFKTFASCYLRMAKPSPKLYRYVLKKMHAKAGEALFIDNNAKNVEGARSIGIKSIKFISYEQLLERLMALGIAVD
ncbi:MAG: HAD family phosphatase [Candidatus Micrarchaeaceae archaeon]